MNYRHSLVAVLILGVAVSGCRHKPKLSDDYEPRDLPGGGWEAGSGSQVGGNKFSSGSGNHSGTVRIPPPKKAPSVSGSDLADGTLFQPVRIGDKIGDGGVADGERWETVVYFAYNKSFIGAAEVPKLEKLADYMQNRSGVKVVIEGHCDERGSEEYNRALGERRAIAIGEYLETLGINDSRIQTISYGEERLAAKGNDESDHALNRRGEFVILGAP